MADVQGRALCPGSTPGAPLLIQIRSRGGEMPRSRSPKRDKAYQLWLASDGKKKFLH